MGDALIFSRGDAQYLERSRNADVAHLYVPYGGLAITALLQASRAVLLPQFGYRLMVTGGQAGASDYYDDLAAADSPQPLWNAPLRTITPGTLLTYDWDAASVMHQPCDETEWATRSGIQLAPP